MPTAGSSREELGTDTIFAGRKEQTASAFARKILQIPTIKKCIPHAPHLAPAGWFRRSARSRTTFRFPLSAAAAPEVVQCTQQCNVPSNPTPATGNRFGMACHRLQLSGEPERNAGASSSGCANSLPERKCIRTHGARKKLSSGADWHLQVACLHTRANHLRGRAGGLWTAATEPAARRKDASGDG
ncbi:TrmH family RNA methyltransferase [Anopheles sinensis]|uniref:TrmH family RNA methyltransferase n=1 Tax=Anopheles sinensis TaxID=74873 RepID=A0A084WAG9_ANOSI|nr:TrmH family RNA methyltransferase [Anopheles sinensis]